jgi:competence protein ComEC
VGTHPDSDHIGGLDDVLDAVSADVVYMPKAKKETKTYSDVESALKRAGKTADMPDIGKEYTYDSNVILRFLSPSKTYSDANDNSLVVQIAYGKTKFLFMGDAEETAEKDILKKGYDLTCDVLKLGHHGSYTATGADFLKAADPTYAVISCGKNNSYGHPHAEVLARLEDEDVQIYRTDTMGTVRAVSDGTNVKMSTSN